MVLEGFLAAAPGDLGTVHGSSFFVLVTEATGNRQDVLREQALRGTMQVSAHIPTSQMRKPRFPEAQYYIEKLFQTRSPNSGPICSITELRLWSGVLEPNMGRYGPACLCAQQVRPQDKDSFFPTASGEVRTSGHQDRASK